MKEGPYFTIFTPTYNRAHLLPRAYNSLLTQSFNDFEWLIVDDGSDDDTEELIKTWIQEAPFPIRYYRQENSGKHVAINRGVELALGMLFVILDSDDWLTENSLEITKQAWEDIPESEREEFANIWGLTCYPSGEIIGTKFPEHTFDLNTIEIRTKYGISGDKAPVSRTDVRRIYPFPEHVGKYCRPGLVWNRIAITYKTRFINEVLQIKEYQPGGLSHKGIQKVMDYPEGYRIKSKEYLSITNRYIPWKFRSDAMLEYIRSSFHAGITMREQVLEITPHRLLWLKVLPFGIYTYYIDKLHNDGYDIKLRISRFDR